jgi:hypothetical protein
MSFRLTALVGAVLSLSCIQASASTFADQVENFIPGGSDLACGIVDSTRCVGAFQPLDPTATLGAPNGHYLSIGELGSIALGFTGKVIVDGPGDDFIVWGSCNSRNEPASVAVSGDGHTYVLLGNFESGVARYFDLAVSGLASALFVRVNDLEGGIGLPDGLAFDVDAVEALHVTQPVPIEVRTLGQLKAHYR